ncbi:MAG: hypothetical protein ACOYB2_10385, partial [Limnohabitans sp.]
NPLTVAGQWHSIMASTTPQGRGTDEMAVKVGQQVRLTEPRWTICEPKRLAPVGTLAEVSKKAVGRLQVYLLDENGGFTGEFTVTNEMAVEVA